MKIALAQINPTVGDLRSNGHAIVEFARRARRGGADLVVFPELSVTGYPPRDLLLRPAFIDAVEHTITWIARALPAGLAAVVGTPLRNKTRTGKRLFNAAVLLEHRKVVEHIHKSLLPSYDVYDEDRYFERARTRRCVEWRGLRLGIHICEDMWNSDESASWRMYAVDPLAELAADGADLFINLSATPFSVGQAERRSEIIRGICKRFQRPFAAVNQVGANGELIFDGDSRISLADGTIAVRAASFEEDLLIWEMDDRTPSHEAPRTAGADLYNALVLGVRDFVRKTGSGRNVLIDLAGDINSSVVAAVAVDALGAEHVIGVTTPTRRTGAAAVAANLGIGLREIDIDEVTNLGVELREVDLDAVTNIGIAQGEIDDDTRSTRPGEAFPLDRIEDHLFGTLVKTLPDLLLSHSNKTEVAVGGTSYFGDLGVLSDVYASQVYDLARHVNASAGREVIPIPAAPPSTEIDAVLHLYLEEWQEDEAIALRTGLDEAFVRDVIRKVDQAEVERRQAPLTLRVSRSIFVSGRRMPTAAKVDLFPESRKAPAPFSTDDEI